MNNPSIALLEKHFDIALEAPDGIKKLRELILTLAMQGKLVPQNPKDQPASELLKEIEAEKKRLVKAGKIKAPKPLPEIKPENVPYAVPNGWEWVLFGYIAQHNSGKTLDGGRNIGEWRDYITTSNLYWGSFKLETIRQMPIREEELEKCTARKNDLLICEGGEAGRAAVWTYDKAVCFQNHIHRARFYVGIDPYYAYRLFMQMDYSGAIERYRKGVGISNMSSKSLASIPFPLPPLAEQKRIVAKIDQLMALCDSIEQQRNIWQQKRLDIHTAAVTRLLDTQHPADVEDAWAFLQEHFGEFYGVKGNVVELRKAILQLAVMGKLVPQDPKDQPASELLKEIETEKIRLVKEGKIKASKPLPEIKPEEVPYAVPKGWEWVRLGEIGETNIGLTYSPANIADDGIPVLRSSNVQRGLLDFNDIVRVQMNVKESAMVKEGDLLICARNGSKALVGKTAMITGLNEPMAFGAFMAIFRSRFNSYLLRFINSPLFRRMIDEVNTMTINQITQENLRNTAFPLPPLAEQMRIVAKIDQLMSLCDSLEQGIEAATQKQSAVLRAVLAQV